MTSFGRVIRSLRLLVLLVIVVDIMSIVYFIPYNASSLLYAFFIFRDIIVTGTVLYNMHLLFPTIWTKRMVLTISLLLTICDDVGTVTVHRNILLNYVSIPLQCLAFFLLFVQYIKWFIFVFKHTHTLSNKPSVYLGNLYAFSIFIFLCFDWAAYFAPPGDISYTWSSSIGLNYFIMYNYLISGTTITLTVVTIRLGRLESSENQVSKFILLEK
jgi:hypothetical protein